MSLDAKLLAPRYQQEILELFNSLVKKSPPLTAAAKLKKLLSSENGESSRIDDDHELNDFIRNDLERKFKSIPNHCLDASALLTDGPFKGMSLLWVTCYIAASTYSFLDEKDELNRGYSYLLGRLIDKSIPSTICFDTAFILNGKTLSTLWLAMYAHLKSLSKDRMWILHELLKIIPTDDLLRLDFNTLSTKDDGVALSPLALLIEADSELVRHKISHRDFVHKLLKVIPPRKHPGFFNFNTPVLSKEALGMTTLCLAARSDAELIRHNTISEHSPFITILRSADLTTLNFKARILVGHDKGKTSLWYAASMLEDDEEPLDLILEKAHFEQLDFNDKPTESKDRHANKNVLWFVSQHYATKVTSKHLETIFSKANDLSGFDFNNAPSSPKDKHAGQTILWNLGEAALQSKGKAKPFIRVLKHGKQTSLDYGARARQGTNSDKSVLGFALALAMKGSFKALDIILQNIQNFGINSEAIQGFELEMLCHLAKRNHLYPLEILLPHIKFTPALLNRDDSIEASGKNTLFMLIELAWYGYPHFLKEALKEIDINALKLTNKAINSEGERLIKELNCIVTEMSKQDDLSDRPIMKAFLESGYETLVEQLSQFQMASTSHLDMMDYKEICEPIVTLTKKFNLLKVSSVITESKTEKSHNALTKIKPKKKQ